MDSLSVVCTGLQSCLCEREECLCEMKDFLVFKILITVSWMLLEGEYILCLLSKRVKEISFGKCIHGVEVISSPL